MRILSSASKITLLLFATAAVVLTYLKILNAEQFMVLANGVFIYYFSKNTPSGPPSTI